MKNRIVMLFGSPVTSDRANILYNNYIKQTKNQYHELLKNFYKKVHTQWIVKNKRIIFALLIVALTTSIKSSEAKGLIDTAIIKNPSIVAKDTDTVAQLIPIRKDTIIDSQDVRDLVYRKTGLSIPKKVPAEHLMIMYNEAIKKGIPISMYFRWIYMESVFKSNAHSRDGALGYTQLMPSTYKKYRKKLRLKSTPVNNIVIGGTYLREMYDYWDKKDLTVHEKWALTFACYNGNMDRVIAMQGVPKRSARYVKWILKSEYE